MPVPMNSVPTEASTFAKAAASAWLKDNDFALSSPERDTLCYSETPSSLRRGLASFSLLEMKEGSESISG